MKAGYKVTKQSTKENDDKGLAILSFQCDTPPRQLTNNPDTYANPNCVQVTGLLLVDFRKI